MAGGTLEGDADPLPVLDGWTVIVLHGLVEDGGLPDTSLGARQARCKRRLHLGLGRREVRGAVVTDRALHLASGEQLLHLQLHLQHLHVAPLLLELLLLPLQSCICLFSSNEGADLLQGAADLLELALLVVDALVYLAHLVLHRVDLLVHVARDMADSYGLFHEGALSTGREVAALVLMRDVRLYHDLWGPRGSRLNHLGVASFAQRIIMPGAHLAVLTNPQLHVRWCELGGLAGVN